MNINIKTSGWPRQWRTTLTTTLTTVLTTVLTTTLTTPQARLETVKTVQERSGSVDRFGEPFARAWDKEPLEEFGQ